MRTLVGLALSALLFYFGWISIENGAAQDNLLWISVGSALVGFAIGIIGSEIADVFR